MVRVIDVDVKPGHTYEYRLRVQMGNPNQGRNDVASPAYRTPKELQPGEWSELVRVEVEPELRYYAVDEAELKAELKTKYTPLHVNRRADKEKQAVLQAHRWLDQAETGSTKLPVGEWSVAERFPVYRGEYVGQKVSVPVPYWRYLREAFLLAGALPRGPRQPGVPNHPTVEVDFGYKGNNDPAEAILVDFDYHRQPYERVGPKDKPVTDKGPRDKAATVTDPAAPEVLLLSPEGKLLALDGASDAGDKTRKDRVKDFRTRILDVKDKKTRGAPGKTPFSETPGR
jgi:hypothetical protein